MSAIALLIGFILAGQVAAADDRYSLESTVDSSDGGALESLADPLGSEAEPVTPPADVPANGAVNDGMLPLTGEAPSDVAPPAANAADPPYSSTPSGSPSFSTGRTGAGRDYPPASATMSPTEGGATPLGVYPSQRVYPSQPASRSSAPSSANSDERSPSALMRTMLHAPPGSRLAGEPLALSQAVSMAGTRDDQSVCIDVYWDLCSGVADYYLGLHEQDELRRLRSLRGGRAPSAEWQQAESELAVRVSTSQLAALAAQHRLASLISRGGDAMQLPLPLDLPHCGDYQTRYEQNFAGRPNDEAQELAALLPLRYEELKGAGSAVTRAEQWLATVGPTGQLADETAMLRALELLALRRRAFVEIACDYNRRIARYSELATPGEIDATRLVDMLIKSKHVPSTATRSSSTAPSFDRQSRDSSTTSPRTYAEGWTPVRREPADSLKRDDSVEQAVAETQTLRKERSLLVSPSAGRQ